MLQRYSSFGLLILVLLTAGSSVFGQGTSNKGRDFWLGYGNHVRGYSSNTQKMSVYITSDVSTSGKVEIPGIGYTTSFSVRANSITTVDIPQSAYLRGQGLYNLGIHITADRPVVVYSHIYDQNVSGATLVLPTAALGKEYYSINFTQISNQGNSFSYFFVIAVEDSTQVEITPSAATQGHPAGMPFIVNLKKGEVYQVLGQNTSGIPNGFSTGVDLTGSTIRSITTTSQPCKPIAVFSGSGKIAIGCGEEGSGSSDNLYQQVYPTSSWGKKFITVPLKSRNYDIIRVLKSDPSAVVKINGATIDEALFNNNFYHQFDAQSPNVIESDKPIQVVQYAVTQRRSIDCTPFLEPAGDPEMIFLNSVEQNIDQITVYSSSAFLINDHFINVVIETGAAASFRIDGEPANFSPVPGDPAYSYTQLFVNEGVHNLSAQKGFNAIAYGFGSAESYGYSAGANVKSLGIELETRVKNIKAENACVNEPLRFKVNLPYQATRLIWNLNDGLSARQISSPNPDSSYVLNDLTYYIYELPDTIRYTQSGEYTVNVIAEKSLADGCGTSEQLFFDFSIFLPPVPKFSNAADVCAGDSLLFKDESIGQGGGITSWLWDFGDPASGENNFSELQNPAHVYAQGGRYQVKLTVTNGSNCDPVAIVSEINVLDRPIAGFSNTTTTCETIPINFTDLSEIVNGTVTKWKWDFGDGQTSTEKSPVHTYQKAGTYEVTLIATGDRGCESDPFKKTLTIHGMPAADFVLPVTCVADAGAEFRFIRNATGGELPVKYLWSFGDANANSERPNTSELENPVHNYTAAGNYVVTLTVTSENGCERTTTKTLTVNGNAQSGFVVLNRDRLCSSQPVIFEDKGTVDFGELTRVEWVFDMVNNPDSKVVDESPNKRSDAPKKYEFLYPSFGSPAQKTYVVKMTAFSGGACVDEQVQEIVLNAEPQLSFDSLAAVCIDLAPFQITRARLLNDIQGNGRYSGPGVSANGLFNPAAAGAGIHTINYTFVTLNSCSASVSQTISVMALPLADAGADQYALEGSNVRLDAHASGDNLKYKWTPSTGLDRDDVLNPLASPAEDITYTLTVTSAMGCILTDDVFVKVLMKPVIPNAFTPNSDGVNDEWNIKHLDSYPEVTVEVFNRYGNKIYNSIGYTEAWKGKFNGADLPVGTYYYIINPGSGRSAISGSVSILR